jgi:hypothetical protein
MAANLLPSHCLNNNRRKNKNDSNKLASMGFFALNIKKEKLGNKIKLDTITLFTSKKKRKEKKRR